MTTFQLANLDARLVYLALQYHLARPGSELDSETKQTVAHGLAEVAQALDPQLEQAVAAIELSSYQHARLLTAISGTVNELKTYPLLDPVPPERGGGRRSTVPGFDAVLRRLFPDVNEDPEETLKLAGHLMALRRRLNQASEPPATQASRGPTRGRWWRFWERHQEQR